MEFAGLEAPPSRAPFDLLKRQTEQFFPELEYDEVREWMGHRPSTTDSLPVIGSLPGLPNVWAGFGHQHLGLTGGPKTGRWLAQLLAGEGRGTVVRGDEGGTFDDPANPRRGWDGGRVRRLLGGSFVRSGDL